MDDETINKNVKLFFNEFKNRTNLILLILIFVGIGFIAAMFITKNIHDNNKSSITSYEPTIAPNPDDEDWPDDSAKTRIFNDNLQADVVMASSKISEYKSHNHGAIPTDYDSLKRVYRTHVKNELSREYSYDICNFSKEKCISPNSLTWKDNKLTLYFAANAKCDPYTKELVNSKNDMAVYTHLRGESNGITCHSS